MNPGPDKRPRRSIRLKGYAYAQAGAYFVTKWEIDNNNPNRILTEVLRD